MKNKYLFLMVVLLMIIALWSSKKNTTPFLEEEKDDRISVYDQEEDRIEQVLLEEYILGVVAAEMPASFHEEALKAQAIAARSYAVYKMEHATKDYHIIADISNQAYINQEQMKDKWKDEYSFYYGKVKKAVEDTKGLVMIYNDEVIEAFYFAMSNGSTEDSLLVFGSSKDYLAVVDSSWDKDVNNFIVTNKISKQSFCEKLNIVCDGIKVDNINKSSSGRVNTIRINDKTFKGTEVRKLLDLRSTDFEINISEKIEITTKGYGHGVGMSQYGANMMAKNGKNHEEILHHYYQNIEIVDKNV